MLNRTWQRDITNSFSAPPSRLKTRVAVDYRYGKINGSNYELGFTYSSSSHRKDVAQCASCWHATSSIICDLFLGAEKHQRLQNQSTRSLLCKTLIVYQGRKGLLVFEVFILCFWFELPSRVCLERNFLPTQGGNTGKGKDRRDKDRAETRCHGQGEEACLARSVIRYSIDIFSC